MMKKKTKKQLQQQQQQLNVNNFLHFGLKNVAVESKFCCDQFRNLQIPLEVFKYYKKALLDSRKKDKIYDKFMNSKFLSLRLSF